ncbi:hypothetical protein [Parasitella parasitica]|uniref:Uncharacterized protein n=1 Tax=Parasitella parasitica TaxID=35722 RepID=A0A0B7N3Q1_9FUNG|nr:hypothetical protein [Parasitella parasitica]
MSHDQETSTEKDDIFKLPKAILLPKSRAQTHPRGNAITIAQPSEQSSSDKASTTDELVKSFKQCIESSLQPLVKRIADIEKAMLERTASIAQEISTLSINQQTLHHSILDVMEKLDELQFDSDDSCSSFNVPLKRSSNNADNESACSTESSGTQSDFRSSEESYSGSEEEGAEPAPLNDFQLPEMAIAFVKTNSNSQAARTDSRKYTSKFNTSQPTTLSSNCDADSNTSNMPRNSKTVEQTKIINPIFSREPAMPPASAVYPTMTNAPATVATPVQVPAIASIPATASSANERTMISGQTATAASTSIPIRLPPSDSTPAPPASTEAPQITALKTTDLATKDKITPTRQSNRRKTQNKGFTYLYLNSSSRHHTDVKDNLCTLGIDPSKILDVHFPRSKIVAVLFPDDYLHNVTDIFIKYKISILLDFDPLDPKNLGDPKYKNLPLARRAKLMQEFHSNQICRALDNMKEPVKFEVLCDFEKKGWINKELAAKFALEVFSTKSKDNGTRNHTRKRNRNRNHNAAS